MLGTCVDDTYHYLNGIFVRQGRRPGERAPCPRYFVEHFTLKASHRNGRRTPRTRVVLVRDQDDRRRRHASAPSTLTLPFTRCSRVPRKVVYKSRQGTLVIPRARRVIDSMIEGLVDKLAVLVDDARAAVA